MTHHPHIHMIVPGGGLAHDGSRWISCKPNFLLPVRVLSKLFRRLMLEKLAAAHAAGQLQFFGVHAHLADAKAFAAFLAPLRKTRWFVYSKRPFAGPKAVLAYLSRYTHRVAISNRRLIAFDGRRVTFKVKDYRVEGPGRYTTMTLDVDEFIRRFLIHVLPKAFTASATTVCSPEAIAPRPLRPCVSCWTWPRLRPRRLQPMLRQTLSRPARPIRYSRSHARALAAAAACSSSRLSSPAASRVIGRPHRSSRSGSTPHDRKHDLSHHPARFALVIDRQRSRAA
jgi:hypothetical protein